MTLALDDQSSTYGSTLTEIRHVKITLRTIYISNLVE